MNQINQETVPLTTVLAVDDNEMELDLLREAFYDVKGMELLTALSGEEALRIMCENWIDIILLDVRMPRMNGFGLLHRIREMQDAKEILQHPHIIMVTATQSFEDHCAAYKAGAKSFTTKPYDIEALNAQVLSIAKDIQRTKRDEENHEKELDELREQLEKLKNGKTLSPEELEKISQLTELGKLAASVVHDANKFLPIISMLLESSIIPTLRLNLNQSTDWVQGLMNDLMEVFNSTTMCRKFFDSLLSANRDNQSVNPVNVIEIINKSRLVMNNPLEKAHVQCAIEVNPGESFWVTGTEELIRVFMNQIGNAIDALKGIKNANIIFQIKKMDKSELEGEGFIQIFMTDNGSGIDPESLKKLNSGERFSTKGADGNGWGTIGSRKTVMRCGGELKFESKVGQGTTVIITLPAAKSPEQSDDFGENVELF